MEAKSMVGGPDGGRTVEDLDEMRTHLHGMWAAVAAAWGENADYADVRGAEATERMLELTLPQPGERVLELACGPGSLGLAAARLVEPDGEVVLSDVVEEMTSIAAARAEQRGHRNVTARVLDLESIDEPDNSYDIVLCREGLMFAADPARAAREILRVLRPEGRFAVAVWGPRSRNPWLGVLLDAVGAQLGRPVPPPGIPGPFALEDAERLHQLLTDAGLDDVLVGELPVPLHAASFEEWWTRTSALAGPLAKLLEAMPEEAVQALQVRLQEAVKPYKAGTGLDFPGVTLLASGHRPPVG